MKRSSITRTATIAFATTLLAITVLAQSQASKAGQQKTLTGVVSDNMCGAQHMLKDKTAAECTRLCVKQGQKYALVVGQTVYTLEGHATELEKLAGARATVKGKVSGDTVTVESVTAAKG
jgi:hypothetical protein